MFVKILKPSLEFLVTYASQLEWVKHRFLQYEFLLYLFRMRYRRFELLIICLCIVIIVGVIIFIKLDNCESQRFTNPSSTSKTFLLIVITSASQNVKKRESIRNSWLKLASDNTKHIFVIGGLNAEFKEQELIDEQKKYHDLVFLRDTSDTYDSLTSKVLNAFVHANQFWSFRFLLKCDDDSFVRPSDMVHELTTKFIHVKNLYWGFFNGNAVVKRYGRWKETKWNLCDRYLPYALGGGYVLSYSLVQFIAKNQQYLA